MIALDVATVLLLSGVFVLQALTTDYYLVIAEFHAASYIFVGVDALLLLYIFSSVSQDHAASRGGITWLFYSWSLLGKLVIYYWFVLTKPGVTLEHSVVFNYIRVDVALFLTPILYAILAFRSGRLLHGSTGSSVSLESMLHADMVVHVTLDLLDLMMAFHLPDSATYLVEPYGWLRVLIGVLVIVGIFMHSYSFPTTFGTTASSSAAARNQPAISPRNQQNAQYTLLNPHQPSSQGDIFLTRKHAALVAMFLVDIPLLFIRIFLAVTFPNVYGLKPILVKNVLFIPLQAFRLNQCRLAEKERAKNTQKKSFHSESGIWSRSSDLLLLDTPATAGLSTSAPPLDQRASYPSSPVEPSPKTTSHQNRLAQKLHRRKGGSAAGVHGADDAPHDTAAADASRQSYLRSHSKDSFRGLKSSSQNQFSKPYLRSQPSYNRETDLYVSNNASDGEENVGGRQAVDGTYDESLPERPAETLDGITPTRLRRLIKDVNTVRRIPVKGFRFWSLVVRIFQCMRIGGRRGLAALLDDTFVLGYWKQIRLAFPLILAWSSQILLVCVAHGAKNPDGPWKITTLMKWKDVPYDYRWFVFTSGANFVLMFCWWLMAAPLLDVFFVTVLWVVRLTAFFLTFATVRDSGFLNIKELKNSPIKIESALLWAFLIIPCFRLLDALFPIQSAFLGRKYMYYVTTSSHQKLQVSLPSTMPSFDDPHPPEHARIDEAGWITTSSLLVFLNCRYALAPMSFSELLIGPDIIKDVRLMDMLVLRGWLETLILFILHCVVLNIFFSFVSLAVFSGHILMLSVYTIFVQAIRLLALRRYEIKLAFEQIVGVSHRQKAVLGHDPFVEKTHWDDSTTSTAAVAAATAVSGYHQRQHDFRHLDHRVSLSKSSLVSLLSAVERHQRQGFFTSPGELFPSFF